MILKARFIKFSLMSVLIGLTAISVFSQKQNSDAKRVMWESVNISERNLFWGPGGQEMMPVLEKSQYIGRQEGGVNIKHRIKDGAGREWVVKVGRETQPETAAVRLLWGIGYKTEINYLLPKIEITRIGNFKNARLEARPDNIKRLDRWSWLDNPFNDTNELEGLKIMMAMFNNWDLKDENTVVLKIGDQHHYVISDLGATFGKLSEESGGKSGRTVNNPTQYSESKFIKEVHDGMIEFDYRGKEDHLIKNIKVEHGRWLADLLMQLSDKQIEDAFRAANYKPEEVKLFAQAFRARINELDAATKTKANTTANN